MATFAGLYFTCFLALGASAQAIAYTDANTGITFQGYTTKGYTFGLAIPENVTTDFIGQISASITQGWAGVSMAGPMIDSLLVVAYPNQDSVVTSIREAVAHSNPGPITGTDATLKPIVNGTFVNTTSFTFTFLCSNCILDDGRTFTPDEEVASLGYAMSSNALVDPSDSNAILNFHSVFGEWNLNLTSAKSPNFQAWAAMASNGTTGGNGTIPGNPGTNSTIPVPVSNYTYDYIVAGGGPSGIIVAERIAETGASVLLLERGPASLYSSGGDILVPWNDTITPYDIPAFSFYLSSMEGAGDNFCTDTAGMAGCLLGGGTSVNELIWVKPARHDFDDGWPAGWQWDDVSAAADRVYERNEGTISPSADGKYYDQVAYDVLSQHLLANGWTSGNAIEDPDNKHLMFDHTTYNVKNGMRYGTVHSYLPLAQALENFTLQLNTKVVRAIRTNSTITGVEVDRNGSRQIINLKAGGRVILAAGSMSTPRILFNSGIGPTEQIKIVQSGSTQVTLPAQSAWIDLPVGKIIQDHPIWYVRWNITDPTVDSISLSSDNLINPSSELTSLFATGSGPLAQGDPRLDYFTDVTNSDGSVRYLQGSCFSQYNGSITMIVYLTHGLTSKGELGITASGATEFITTPWMNTDGDSEAVESFMNTLLEYSRKPGSLLSYAGPANATGKDLFAAAPQSSEHYVGTARMGLDDGRDGGSAVVDLDTKVYGTDNLFVVDASIHPDLPTGNTQAMVMVVAEKAVEKILALSRKTTGGGTNEALNLNRIRAATAGFPVKTWRSETEKTASTPLLTRGVQNHPPVSPVLKEGRLVRMWG